MELQWNFSGTSVELQWNFSGTSVELQWNFSGTLSFFLIENSSVIYHNFHNIIISGTSGTRKPNPGPHPLKKAALFAVFFRGGGEDARSGTKSSTSSTAPVPAARVPKGKKARRHKGNVMEI